MWLEAKGTFAVDDEAAKLDVDKDFIRYYRKFIYKHFYQTIRFQFPMHDAHITIARKKLHKGIDLTKVEDYIGTEVLFQYQYDILQGAGGEKGFVNFYMPVRCPFADFIKRKLNIVESETYLGMHITICNTKNINAISRLL